MNREQIETMYKAFFEELSGIEKEAMEKQALAGIGMLGKGIQSAGQILRGGGGVAEAGKAVMGGAAQAGRSLYGAGAAAVRDPTAAMGVMKNVYGKAGGGLAGAKAVMGTPLGQAATLAGGTALAVPAAGGFMAGRAGS